MPIVRKSAAEAKPFRFTPAQRARLEGMTEEEIEQNAREDPDNQPYLEDGDLAPAVFGRRVRLLRRGLGLSQAEFGSRFKINPGRLKDWEQGRSRPDSVSLSFVKLIECEPDTVARVLAAGPVEAA